MDPKDLLKNAQRDPNQPTLLEPPPKSAKSTAENNIRAVQYHIKNLGDKDPAIRENSAEMLGILNAPEAVPHLIEALKDRHIMVQYKAHGALNKITGKNFGYKNYPEWRKWWDEEGKDFNKKENKGPNETKRVLAKTSNTQGLLYRTAGNFQQALGMFLDAVNQDPEIPDYRNNLGLVVMDLGRPIEAMGYFEETIGLDASLPEPYMNIGQCYARMHRQIEAEAWFKKAIVKDKGGKLWEDLWLLGKEYLKNGEYPMAYEFLDQARVKAEQNRRHDPRIYRDLALTHYALDQIHSAWKEIKNVETLGYALDEGFVLKVRKELEAQGIDPEKEDESARQVLRQAQE